MPDELADGMCLLGPIGRIRERLELWRKSPVTTLLVMGLDIRTGPAGDTRRGARLTQGPPEPLQPGRSSSRSRARPMKVNMLASGSSGPGVAVNLCAPTP